MFKFDLTVRGYELDSFGHVNNSVYLNYLEQARWEIFREMGLLELFTEKNLMLVVTEMKIRYSREVKIFDEVEVHSVFRKESPYLVFDHKMYFRHSRIRICSAEVKCLFTDREKVKYDIPDAFLAKLR